ncbi:reticulophagy regulator 3-like [Ischnura elegans]|uniref:reticulophagy regulator 3-like n=1 Tax=Ischnura elegans TaxID=197161 RepID=UPI001ED87BB9|nr:reticulophagy regulator 3-like [Ischnura elegans]
MTTWRTFFWRLWPWKRDNEDEKCSFKSNDRIVNRFDQYAVLIEYIAVWENPLVSAACVLLVNLIFWFIYAFERKFYCILTLVLWFILFYNFWNEHLFPFVKSQSTNFAVFGDWCYRNCRTSAVKEDGRYYVHLRTCASKFYCWMVKCRQDYPGLFCAWMLTFFMSVAALGQALPGLPLAYAASMLLLVGPALALRFWHPSLHKILLAPSTPSGDEVEEYLPESSGEALAVLAQAADLSVGAECSEGVDDDSLIPRGDLTNSGADSTAHISALDLDVLRMPPHDDQESLEGSLDAPEEFALTPCLVDGVRRRRKRPQHQGEDVMCFESTHFDGSSSEEEGEALSLLGGGGKVGPMGQLLGQLLVRTGAAASVALAVQGRVAQGRGVQSRAAEPPPSDDDESDEDFEMISEEDLS